MVDSAPRLPPEAGQNLFDSLLSIYVQPDLERRAQAGHPFPPNTPLSRIQVVFNVGREAEVRLNDEISGVIEARAARALEQGEEVMSNDISEITRVELTDSDPDAAHITAIQLGDGWHIAWDGRYNARLIEAHLATAHEFVELAAAAVERGMLRGFVENAFEAAELLAKAEILALPDERLLTAKTHGTIAAQFNRWSSATNIDRRYVRLLNELGRLRAPARYLRGAFGLELARAAEMLTLLREMEARANTQAPRRTIGANRGPVGDGDRESEL